MANKPPCLGSSRLFSGGISCNFFEKKGLDCSRNPLGIPLDLMILRPRSALLDVFSRFFSTVSTSGAMKKKVPMT